MFNPKDLWPPHQQTAALWRRRELGTICNHLFWRLRAAQRCLEADLAAAESSAREKRAERDGSKQLFQAADSMESVQERIPYLKNSLIWKERKERTSVSCSVKSVLECFMCRVHLCKGDCIVLYHQRLAQRVSQQKDDWAKDKKEHCK